MEILSFYFVKLVWIINSNTIFKDFYEKKIRNKKGKRMWASPISFFINNSIIWFIRSMMCTFPVRISHRREENENQLSSDFWMVLIDEIETRIYAKGKMFFFLSFFSSFRCYRSNDMFIISYIVSFHGLLSSIE